MLYLKKNNETQIAYISKNGNYEGKKTYKEGYTDGYIEGMDKGRNNPITTKEVYFSNGIKTNTHNTMVISFDAAIPTSPLKGSNYIETTFFPYWNNGCIFGLQTSSSYLAYIQNEKLYIMLNNNDIVLERPCTYAKWHTLRIYTDRAVFDGEEVYYGTTFETDDIMMACINRGGRGYYRGEIAYIKHTEDEQNTLMWVIPNPDAEQRTLIRVRKDKTGWSRADNFMGIRLQIATANLPISESVVFVEGGGVCPELTELNVTENGTYEGAYNVVNVNVEGGCNIEETRWVTPNTSDIDGSGYLVYHKSDGYDGMDRVALNMVYYNEEKYNEGYNDGKNEIIGSLTELNVTENGVYEGAYNIVNVDVPTESCDYQGNALNYDTIAIECEVSSWVGCEIDENSLLDAENRQGDCMMLRTRTGECIIMTKLDVTSGFVILTENWINKSLYNFKSRKVLKISANAIDGSLLHTIDTGIAVLETNAVVNATNLKNIEVSIINDNLSVQFEGDCFNGLPNEGTITFTKNINVTLSDEEIIDFLKTRVPEGWIVKLAGDNENDLTSSRVEEKYNTIAFRTENIYDGDFILDRTKIVGSTDEYDENGFITYCQNKCGLCITRRTEVGSPFVGAIRQGALEWNHIEYFHNYTIYNFGVDLTRDTSCNLRRIYFYSGIGNGILYFRNGCFATSNLLNKLVFYYPYDLNIDGNPFEGVSSYGEVIVVGDDTEENRAKYNTLMELLGTEWTLTFTDSYNG